MARKKQDIILENVVIEAVAAEGKALARIDGTVLFVQFAVPGDIVDVKVTKKKKNYMEGFILRMVKPSGTSWLPCPVHQRPFQVSRSFPLHSRLSAGH